MKREERRERWREREERGNDCVVVSGRGGFWDFL